VNVERPALGVEPLAKVVRQVVAEGNSVPFAVLFGGVEVANGERVGKWLLPCKRPASV